MRCSVAFLTVLMVAAGGFSAPSFAVDGPSFDCSRARSAVDRAICGDKELSRLDRRLAQIFQLALQTQDDRRPLTVDEQHWVADRAQCGRLAPADVNSCVSETVLARIQDLATIVHVQPKAFIAAMDARERQNADPMMPAPQPPAAPAAPAAPPDQVRAATAQNPEPTRSEQFAVVPAAAPIDRKALLVAAVEKGRQAFAAGANDMAKGAARPRRAKDICAAMPSAAIEKWSGIVETLSSNGDGLGVLSIKIDDNVALKTWNNSFSDIRDHTLIDPNSGVFREASALKVGQKVVFSGTFIPDTTDCFREGSMTLAGSLERPEFIFRFSDISPAD
jgi:uncharacterized protein